MITWLNAQSARRLILVLEKDGQDPGGDIRVGGVIGSKISIGVVVVNLPVNFLVSDPEVTSAVLAIQVIHCPEVLEFLHIRNCFTDKRAAHLPDAGRNLYSATLTSSPKRIVELSDNRRARFSNFVVHSDVR